MAYLPSNKNIKEANMPKFTEYLSFYKEMCETEEQVERGFARLLDDVLAVAS